MTIRVIEGDCRAVLKTLAPRSVHMVVTSPPFLGLRDYGTATWVGGDPACDHLGEPMRTRAYVNKNAGTTADIKNAEGRQPFRAHCGKCGAARVDAQIGLELTPALYVAEMVSVFRGIWRVLRDDGTVWLNLGDSYANDGKWGGSTSGKHAAGLHGETGFGRTKRKTGLKPKDLTGMPWRVAFALQDDDWYLRQDIIWHKPNPMPESAEDRCTKAHEYLFLLSKKPRYYFDAEAIAENRTGTEDAPTFRGGSYVHDQADNSAGSARKVPGNSRRRGLTPRHTEYTDSCDQSGLDEVGRGGRRNKRSVWTVPTSPFTGEFCRHCRTFFDGARLKALRVERVPTAVEGETTRVRHCSCGKSDGWVAHFATFPTELIVDCIKASTSEKGCCSACAAPYERVTEKRPTGETQKMPDGFATHTGGERHGTIHKDGREPGKGGNPVMEIVTIGWRPTCKCTEATPVPCTVLEPFGGAGTTGLVADRLGRDAILIELNPAYAEMARQRLRGDSPLFAEVS